MNRQSIYLKTDEFMKGRWASIVLVNLLVGLIATVVISLILTVFNATVVQGANLMLRSSDTEIMLQGTQILAAAITQAAMFARVLTGSISAALSIEILKAYKTDGRVTIGGVFSTMFSNLGGILTILVILALAGYILGYIPLVGGILSIVLSYAVSFAYYYLNDNEDMNGIDALKASLNGTKGHKWNLFVITFKYAIMPFLAIPVVIIGAFFTAVVPSLGAIIMVFASMLMFALLIKYLPYITAAQVVYYAEVNKEVEVEVVEPEVIG